MTPSSWWRIDGCAAHDDRRWVLGEVMSVCWSCMTGTRSRIRSSCAVCKFAPGRTRWGGDLRVCVITGESVDSFFFASLMVAFWQRKALENVGVGLNVGETSVFCVCACAWWCFYMSCVSVRAIACSRAWPPCASMRDRALRAASSAAHALALGRSGWWGGIARRELA